MARRAAVQTSAPGLFDQLDREMWFIDRMHQHGVPGVMELLAGVTDDATRRERIREAIHDHHLGDVVIGRHNGRSETYMQCFARVLGGAHHTSKESK